MADSLEHHLDRQVEHSRDFFWHRVRWAAVKAQFPQGRPFTVVDVGAGVGLLGDYMREEFPEASYKYTEPIEGLEQSLEERFGADNNLAGETHWQGADVVTLLDVTEHIQDDYAFIEDIVSKMPAGCKLVMTVPALNKLWSGWDDALGHYRRYDKGMLRSLFRPFPVDVHEISYLFPEMVPAAMIRKRTKTSSGDQDAEFPDLSKPVNKLFQTLGTATMRARKLSPRGTSALVVAVKHAGP
jgi:hypothetical protein